MQISIIQRTRNESKLHVSAMYHRNFKPQIFTDITKPVKQS